MSNSAETRYDTARTLIGLGGPAAVLYLASGGEALKAILVPAIGLAVGYTAHYLNAHDLAELGTMTFLSGAIALPGAATTYAICAAGGNALATRAIAVVAGSAITYKVFQRVIGFAVDSAMGLTRARQDRLSAYHAS